MKKGIILAWLSVLLIAIIAVTLTACGEKSPLIGKWQYVEDEGMYFEFFSDGRVEMGVEPNLFSGTYEETGEKEVTLTLVSLNGEIADESEQLVLEYSFSEDDLVLTNGEATATFIPVK
jgi:hypothetical protein